MTVSASKDVIRCAKQIYNHLGLRHRISLLSNQDSQPQEVIQLETLHSIDQQSLNSVVKAFLQWSPPEGVKKTIQDLIARVEDAIVELCGAPDDELLSDDPLDHDIQQDDDILLDDDMLLDDAMLLDDEILLDDALIEDEPLEDDLFDGLFGKIEFDSIFDDEFDMPTTPSQQAQCTVKRALPDKKIPEAKKSRKESAFHPHPPPSPPRLFHDEDDMQSPPESTPPLSPFSDACSLETNTAENTICSLSNSSRCFDNVPWLIQFEIARFLYQYRLKMKDLTFEALQKFFAVIKVDPRQLYQVMLSWYNTKQGKSPTDHSSYALMESCSDQVWNHLESNTKNRMIHYGAIVKLSTTEPPKMLLRAPTVGASNRFFRKYGQDRFLEMKLSKHSDPSLIQQQKEFFLKPFIVMGRTFEFLFIKDNTLILFATKGPKLEEIPIFQVIRWHIPIEENYKMPLNKFASRMTLGYSNSIPTLLFSKESIRYVDDIYSDKNGEEETCMTDGCGIISCAAMRKIMQLEGKDDVPCAIQGRIAGAKGIWILSPELDFTSGEWIEIRKSQNKFKTGVLQKDASIDPLHYTFDLVKRSVCVYPASLNTQFIQCLSSGGVPTEVFVVLLQDYLHRLSSVITGSKDIKLLRDWVVKEGNLMRTRLDADIVEKGLWVERAKEEDTYVEWDTEDTDDVVNISPLETQWRINKYSGFPAMSHEAIVRLIDSGFDLTNKFVAGRVTQVFRDAMRNLTTKYKIEIQQSCMATCIPDPSGTLKEGEIFIQLSSRRVEELTGIKAGVITGDVVVTRNPCGLQSDVQKVVAVDCPALQIYTDLIVFSIKGERSLASMLGGGDYDGDIVFCCWDQRVVEPFKSSPVPPIPIRMKGTFVQNNTPVRALLSHTRDPVKHGTIFQKHFISISSPDSILGTYENWRTVMAEVKSLEDKNVIYLALMCAKLVDASKQGLTIKDEVLKRDQIEFQSLKKPRWFLDKRNKMRYKDFVVGESEGTGKGQHRPQTTMDHLFVTLLKETDTFEKHTKGLTTNNKSSLIDSDLAEYWTNMYNTAKKNDDTNLLEDLEFIKKKIDECVDAYNKHCKQIRVRRYGRVKKSAPVNDEEKFSTTFDLEEHFSSIYHGITSTKSQVLRYDARFNGGQIMGAIKASYAYICTIDNGKFSNYCYVVAFDEIRRLKADASTRPFKENGLSESMSPELYIAMNVDRSWMRRLNASIMAKEMEKAKNNKSKALDTSSKLGARA
ncbi:RNA-dependent RNA polymerase RdRP [Phycomyces blakesleeanus NRRL 1555(-)]|uniref:RNA-dependent RNA polymerase n=1 Tax=Phycomyces blakesleeanus (strain ATCC 8743b / DSM 1359 / FGSC 10004 / NBRC 33097 / NRRL 1555) TaxID=763407 RepID=A0A167NFN8_PHYB8|nr:RNA-dependent RNA polymerase RdRP [Phycomyces blakesleeanus NRRL 1555(-)]OAD75789.1 RNA-dependent RNA polymerase RdRP [Phycomyces blakesleeanus NRRL 1555(-)]|eukprot:XP_018293829.1 RNA-dependent RNA polymerase RdRP [Phycomyces blakesleeanus NRRL 1555(-)]